MDEPPLWEIEADEAYRILWLRSFDPAIAVRISRTGSSRSLTAISLSRMQSSDQPRDIEEQTFRQLSRSNWSKSVELIDQSQFWDLPPIDLDEIIASVDGAQWILEGFREGSYHVVARTSPSAEGELSSFRAALLHLLQISKLEISPIY